MKKLRPNRRTGIMKKCPICAKSFYATRSTSKTRTYCSKKCYWESLKGKPSPTKGIKRPNRCGKNHHNWKNGRTKDSNGYILILNPTHPSALPNRYVFEHRLVVEQILGRYLESFEDIHHIDRNKSNNAPSNLYIFESRSAHTKYEWDVKKSKIIPIMESNLTH